VKRVPDVDFMKAVMLIFDVPTRAILPLNQTTKRRQEWELA
jgi:hypothetical protein